MNGRRVLILVLMLALAIVVIPPLVSQQSSNALHRVEQARLEQIRMGTSATVIFETRFLSAPAVIIQCSGSAENIT